MIQWLVNYFWWMRNIIEKLKVSQVIECDSTNGKAAEVCLEAPKRRKLERHEGITLDSVRIGFILRLFTNLNSQIIE